MWNKLGKLSDEMISNLNEYYNKNKDKLKVRDSGSVKNVKRLNLDYTDNPDILDIEFEIYNLVNNKTLKPYASYMLEYYEDSFTLIHNDSIGDSKTNSITTVTLFDKSNDLSGGKILISDEKDNSIIVIEQEVGEVISYNRRISHGVSRVLKGNRRVLINWYNSRADDIK